MTFTAFAEVQQISLSKELEAVTGSPRFQAAVKTGDSATVAGEAPLYADMLGTQLFVVGDAQGRIVFAEPHLEGLDQSRCQ